MLRSGTFSCGIHVHWDCCSARFVCQKSETPLLTDSSARKRIDFHYLITRGGFLTRANGILSEFPESRFWTRFGQFRERLVSELPPRGQGATS